VFSSGEEDEFLEKFQSLASILQFMADGKRTYVMKSKNCWIFYEILAV